MTPELPTESFGGLTLTITGDKAYLFNQAGDYYPLYVAEEQTGELINEAVIKRDRLVEERLGVELVYRAEASTDYFKTVQAGDPGYDIITQVNSEFVKGICRDFCLISIRCPILTRINRGTTTASMRK